MLAASHADLLQWHLIKHPSRSLSMCIAAIADDGGAGPGCSVPKLVMHSYPAPLQRQMRSMVLLLWCFSM